MEVSQGMTTEGLTPSQVYQRMYQRKYREWKLEMKSLGTPWTNRAVPRLSRRRLAYEVTTRYSRQIKEIDNNVANSYAPPSTSNPAMVHATPRAKDFPLVLGRSSGPLEDQISSRVTSAAEEEGQGACPQLLKNGVAYDPQLI